MSTDRERTLARALKAALKWTYDRSMRDHIMHGVDDPKYDPSYIADIADIRAGVLVADMIKEPAL